MPTYRNLLAQKAALDRKIEQARKREVGAVIKQINGFIAEYGLRPEDLTFPAPGSAPVPRGRRGRSAKSVVASVKAVSAPPKYRDPETGKTWTGRGRAPKWIVGDKEKYLIS